MFKQWRRKHVCKKAFPEQWEQILLRCVPYYDALSDADKTELKKHIQIFLAEKRFEGCAGLNITDEIRVTIAAQACILLLHRETDYYPILRTILVYPEAYVATQRSLVHGGIVRESDDVRLGESWSNGTVVLSWDDVISGTTDAHDGKNVVFHEFAHQIDSSHGRGDSSEVLRSPARFKAWARILSKDFEKLQQQTRKGQPTFLNKYGATNTAEFFAVATENFFERPDKLKQHHPELYRALSDFYQQEPQAND